MTTIDNSAPSDVLDGLLFLGNARCAKRLGHEFDLVVNCTKDVPEPASGRRLFVRIPIDDDPTDAVQLFRILRDADVLDVIDETVGRGGRCLVHCVAGAQRSAAVVAGYLVARRGFGVDEAVAHVRSRRPAAFFFGVHFERTLRLLEAEADRRDEQIDAFIAAASGTKR